MPVLDLSVITDDDPYGDAISAMKRLISRALEKEGKMSDKEKSNLIDIEEVIRMLDNA